MLWYSMKGSGTEPTPRPAGQPPPALRLGQLVTARAGRDTGRPYLVVGVRTDGRVLVADGRYRRVERAKAKNPRHLWIHDRVAEEVARRLEQGEPVSDSQIYQALCSLVGRGPAEGGESLSGAGPS